MSLLLLEGGPLDGRYVDGRSMCGGRIECRYISAGTLQLKQLSDFVYPVMFDQSAWYELINSEDAIAFYCGPRQPMHPSLTWHMQHLGRNAGVLLLTKRPARRRRRR